MNPLTKVKLINELNKREAELGVIEKVSWHSEYQNSAWIFVGGLPYELTEGDILCVFSQYGEIVNINLVRDKKTGKSKGFCFLCYEDQRSTILAVDNFNGIKIKGRTIRVDHVANYRPPKDSDDIDDVTRQLREDGCAPKTPGPSSPDSSQEEDYEVPVKKHKKEKKEKKKKKKEKKEEKKKGKGERLGSDERSTEAKPSSSRSSGSPPGVRVKEEKKDLAYEKYVSKNQEYPREQRPEGRDQYRGRTEGGRATIRPSNVRGADSLRDRGEEKRYHRDGERDQRHGDGQSSWGRQEDQLEKDRRDPYASKREERFEERGRREERFEERGRKEERLPERNTDKDRYRKYEADSERGHPKEHYASRSDGSSQTGRSRDRHECYDQERYSRDQNYHREGESRRK
ncbi:RNA-binding motif protein, X-linked 2 [Latimeria chalumnae]|uniref:RNA-binding motif protein, X-linked 2 n=1 Tax=Latimeria chalumnae TaxID=7897 RepID=UPI0006D9373B|nr:PREDICTED: RNA-binding motif protein, X-linked 2 [Latimeria chalumnae]|eukprot:XP_014352674.1 PREDICTED: RNA-binding motif protein, X-linked 2 [Latimeria chalumnae]